jgi:hypothetical protein
MPGCRLQIYTPPDGDRDLDARWAEAIAVLGEEVVGEIQARREPEQRPSRRAGGPPGTFAGAQGDGGASDQHRGHHELDADRKERRQHRGGHGPVDCAMDGEMHRDAGRKAGVAHRSNGGRDADDQERGRRPRPREAFRRRHGLLQSRQRARRALTSIVLSARSGQPAIPHRAL